MQGPKWGKGIRAGKATHLLKQNVQAPVIMDRAEWKYPKTMAKYADEDLIDPSQVLLAHMEKSDDEDEQEMKHCGFLGGEPAPREHHSALEMGRGSNVLPEVKEAQTPEPVTAGQGATMGMSPEESTAQSPEVTVASQATGVQPPPFKKKKIEVDDLQLEEDAVVRFWNLERRRGGRTSGSSASGRDRVCSVPHLTFPLILEETKDSHFS